MIARLLAWWKEWGAPSSIHDRSVYPPDDPIPAGVILPIPHRIMLRTQAMNREWYGVCGRIEYRGDKGHLCDRPKGSVCAQCSRKGLA